MKLIDISVEKLPQDYTLNGIYRQIEIGGRNCYQSEPKEGVTPKDFADMLQKRGHLSCFEHGTVYLQMDIPKSQWNKEFTAYDFYNTNPYSRVTFRSKGLGNSVDFNRIYVTTNMRVLVENNRTEDLKYLHKPTLYHYRRTTFHIVCPIGITREFNRHRVLSISEQSTRYCNFSKDKFGNKITFVKPLWYNSEHKRLKEICFDVLLKTIERYYLDFLNVYGLAPQEARDGLSLCTASSIIYTAFDDDWKEIINKRIIPQAHPQAQLIAKQLQELL